MVDDRRHSTEGSLPTRIMPNTVALPGDSTCIVRAHLIDAITLSDFCSRWAFSHDRSLWYRETLFSKEWKRKILETERRLTNQCFQENTLQVSTSYLIHLYIPTSKTHARKRSYTELVNVDPGGVA